MTLIDIRVKLLKKGLTMTWLAEKLGVSRSYMYRELMHGNKKLQIRIKEALK